MEEEDENIRGNWGEKPLPPHQPIVGRAEDVIRKHKEHANKGILNLMDKGALSTTKKIVQTSITSFKKMQGFDDVLM